MTYLLKLKGLGFKAVTPAFRYSTSSRKTTIVMGQRFISIFGQCLLNWDSSEEFPYKWDLLWNHCSWAWKWACLMNTDEQSPCCILHNITEECILNRLPFLSFYKHISPLICTLVDMNVYLFTLKQRKYQCTWLS